MTDLTQRVPGHSLIDELLRQWDIAAIRVDESTDQVVIDDEARSWYWGVLGEKRVASHLALLGESAVVLHSVPVGEQGSDIDHVVISPAGVFTINAKYSPGKQVTVYEHTVYVGGFQQKYVRNSRAEAKRASALLSAATGFAVPVTALLVFVDPSRITTKGQPGGTDGEPGVRVISDVQLQGALIGRPVFSDEQVAQIGAVAARPATWQKNPVPSTVGKHVELEFEALQSELGPRLEHPKPAARANGMRAARAQRPTRPAKPSILMRFGILLAELALIGAVILGLMQFLPSALANLFTP